LIALPNGPGWLLFGIVWTGAILGILGRIFFPHAHAAIVAAPYVVVGWSSLFVVNHVWDQLAITGFVLLVVGGVLYTVGAVIYATKRPDPWPDHFGYHEIFHALTVAGAACHYVVIAVFVRDLI
jgi:hemolysin III